MCGCTQFGRADCWESYSGVGRRGDLDRIVCARGAQSAAAETSGLYGFCRNLVRFVEINAIMIILEDTFLI